MIQGLYHEYVYHQHIKGTTTAFTRTALLNSQSSLAWRHSVTWDWWQNLPKYMTLIFIDLNKKWWDRGRSCSLVESTLGKTIIIGLIWNFLKKSSQLFFKFFHQDSWCAHDLFWQSFEQHENEPVDLKKKILTKMLIN